MKAIWSIKPTPAVRAVLLLILLELGAGWLYVPTAWAQTPVVTDDQVNAIARQLYCPVCENIPLDVCPTQACAEWRDLIRQKLQAGWNGDQIKAYFVQQYGDRVLGTPPARGLNWLVYIIPPLAILGGVFILYRALKAYRKPLPQSSPPPPPAEPADEYVARLEEELRKR
jgi:cytochrome c-type biogenesis protein CcmH